MSCSLGVPHVRAARTTAFLPCLHLTCSILCYQCYQILEETEKRSRSLFKRVTYLLLLVTSLQVALETAGGNPANVIPSTSHRVRLLIASDISTTFINIYFGCVSHGVNLTSNPSKKERIIDAEMEERWRSVYYTGYEQSTSEL